MASAPAYNYEDLDNNLKCELLNEPQTDTLILHLKRRFQTKNIVLTTHEGGYMVISGHAQGEGNKWIRFRKIFTLPSNSNYDLSDLEKIIGILDYTETILNIMLTKLPKNNVNETLQNGQVKLWPPKNHLIRVMVGLFTHFPSINSLPLLGNCYLDIDPKCEWKDDGTLQLHLPGFTNEQLSIYITECRQFMWISGHKPCEKGRHDWTRFSKQFHIIPTDNDNDDDNWPDVDYKPGYVHVKKPKLSI
ncbi:unnamed protein product [Cuscuta epithymum]|uniref:SHSP domain-containing protein n=1 Tax=Cuscuta epithymum TaxID=186058 RepID=A0AAV0CQC9_9ASTE|nr:unnamed protein product [Cuscuta epithymum]